MVCMRPNISCVKFSANISNVNSSDMLTACAVESNKSQADGKTPREVTPHWNA